MPHRLPEPDRIRLCHMLDAAEQALAFSDGRSRSDLDADLMYRRAVLHCIQEIGEAAARVAEDSRVVLPQFPWRQVVGMRHALVHAYFQINLDLVWAVVENELRPLVDSLRRVLANQ